MAKRICIGCPVRQECLDYALVSNQRFGIWGGLTEEERRPVRRRWLMQTRRLVS
jgi:WhiB family redox-sensing transcriptional regulator